MINKVGAKRLPDLVLCSIFFSEIPLDFQELIPLKYFMYFLAGINTK